MKIKKTSETTPKTSQTVNQYSESTQDTYSCDYINELNEYATTEKRIGTWIDGKPLYRKVIPFAFSNISVGDTQYIALGTDFANYEIVKMDNIVNVNSKDCVFTLNRHSRWGNEDEVIALSIIGGGVNLAISVLRSDYAPYTSFKGYVILEYTKTTDEGGNS